MEGKNTDEFLDSKELNVKYKSSRELKIKKRIKDEKYNKFLLCSSVVVCLLLISCLVIYLLMPKLTLKGNKEIIINYGHTYKEKGYKASYFSDDLSKKVKVKGKVNNKKIGKYKIVYSVSNGIFTKRVTRVVIVSDNNRPSINLVGDKITYVCPQGEFVEPGFKAIDNYDGDITDKVSVKKQPSQIVYEVRDKSQNYKKVVRKIIYKDIEKPTIELTGGDIISSFIGDEYKDPGFKAIDNCNGDLTKKVEVSGTVNNEVPGTYTVTYKVIDESGNESVVTRTVIIAEHGQNGTIYLTFDDGPREGTTNIILDILKENNIKATFFVTNSGPDELIKRAFDEGHTIALHTGCHDYSKVYASVDAYFEDLNSVKSRVDKITGQDTKIIRFPGGSGNTVSRKYSEGIMSTLTSEVIKRGYLYYDWSINSGDAGAIDDADELYKNVTSKIKKDRVNMILMHDIKSHTRDALERIIKYAKENGYVFDKITSSTEMITEKVNN